MVSRIEALTARAVRDFAHIQAWPNQFRRRAVEMRSALGLADLSPAMVRVCGQFLGIVARKRG